MGSLPKHMNFKMDHVVSQIVKLKASRVGVQMPEGLLVFACAIVEELESRTGAEVTIMADVVYGACCVDDIASDMLGLDLLVHYGHSCLVPVDQTLVKTIYVAVTVTVDTSRLIQCLLKNFPASSRLSLMGTVQFTGCLESVKNALESEGYVVDVPCVRPLSAGETLGCTAPVIPASTDAIVFLADGRFHLEAAMMANPEIPAFRYCPYTHKLFSEKLNMPLLKQQRAQVLRTAKSILMESQTLGSKPIVGVIIGTLGRQGSLGIAGQIFSLVAARGFEPRYILLTEVNPQAIKRLSSVIPVFVQIACPRLSIDWGPAYDAPVLTPHEAFQLFSSSVETFDTTDVAIAMDYYSNAGGPWANYAQAKQIKSVVS